MSSLDDQLYRIVKVEVLLFKIKHTHNFEQLESLKEEYYALMDDIVPFDFEDPEHKVNEDGEFGAYY